MARVRNDAQRSATVSGDAGLEAVGAGASPQPPQAEPANVATNVATSEASSLCAVEEHAERCSADPAVCAGMMVYNGWAAGKQISEATYHEGVAAFLQAAAGESAKDGE